LWLHLQCPSNRLSCLLVQPLPSWCPQFYSYDYQQRELLKNVN
jgi:hypothetical protein